MSRDNPKRSGREIASLAMAAIGPHQWIQDAGPPPPINNRKNMMMFWSNSGRPMKKSMNHMNRGSIVCILSILITANYHTGPQTSAPENA